MASLPETLEHARVASLPETAYYIPNFITHDEECMILDKVGSPTLTTASVLIAAAPKPRWKQLTHRRLQTWPSDLVQDRLLDAPLPAWLDDPVVSRLRSLPVTGSQSHIFAQSPHARPNHVLINEYPPGDGAAYWPVVCTVSLGASICLNIHRSRPDGALDPEPVWRILQEPRSLLITTDQLYTNYLHGISDIDQDVGLSADGVANWSLLGDPESFSGGCNARQTRTSLTYRDVLKVSKIGNKLGAFLKK
ncbi:hypothetical protein B0I35DRAFT_473222 [Stachybotrys elegans]|uniref:Alpha-ketoglutarate-dependent dioxygenase AlkB-like domain-containing protein n=1 Tax=Stachybotrys elegans TaxID=80388 RepID=A0A8K0T364_9HYPO|nr:hypothetical protein B0I35DRAFT_473222 [Stachybotrys elegans]